MQIIKRSIGKRVLRGGGSKGCTYIGKGKGGFRVNEHVNVDKFLGAAEHQGNVAESFCKLRIAFVGDA